jgi:site-specific DNA recombinase
MEIPSARRPATDWQRGARPDPKKKNKREAVGERHIRLLAPLAFLSPRIIAAIADGTAAADLTVTGLVKALLYSWAEQERKIGLHSQ